MRKPSRTSHRFPENAIFVAGCNGGVVGADESCKIASPVKGWEVMRDCIGIVRHLQQAPRSPSALTGPARIRAPDVSTFETSGLRRARIKFADQIPAVIQED